MSLRLIQLYAQSCLDSELTVEHLSVWFAKEDWEMDLPNIFVSNMVSASPSLKLGRSRRLIDQVNHLTLQSHLGICLELTLYLFKKALAVITVPTSQLVKLLSRSTSMIITEMMPVWLKRWCNRLVSGQVRRIMELLWILMSLHQSQPPDLLVKLIRWL